MASREERFAMRQRGAGARKLLDDGDDFGFALPGVTKPRREASLTARTPGTAAQRARKTPTPRSSARRRGERLANSDISSVQNKEADAHLEQDHGVAKRRRTSPVVEEELQLDPEGGATIEAPVPTPAAQVEPTIDMEAASSQTASVGKKRKKRKSIGQQSLRKKRTSPPRESAVKVPEELATATDVEQSRARAEDEEGEEEESQPVETSNESTTAPGPEPEPEPTIAPKSGKRIRKARKSTGGIRNVNIADIPSSPSIIYPRSPPNPDAVRLIEDEAIPVLLDEDEEEPSANPATEDALYTPENVSAGATSFVQDLEEPEANADPPDKSADEPIEEPTEGLIEELIEEVAEEPAGGEREEEEEAEGDELGNSSDASADQTNQLPHLQTQEKRQPAAEIPIIEETQEAVREPSGDISKRSRGRLPGSRKPTKDSNASMENRTAQSETSEIVPAAPTARRGRPKKAKLVQGAKELVSLTKPTAKRKLEVVADHPSQSSTTAERGYTQQSEMLPQPEARGNTVPIKTYTVTKSDLPDLEGVSTSTDRLPPMLSEDEPPKPNPSAPDVLAQVSTEVVQAALAKVLAVDTEKQAAKAVVRRRQGAIQAFGDELSRRLKDISRILGINSILARRAKHGQRVKKELWDEVLEARVKKDDLADRLYQSRGRKILAERIGAEDALIIQVFDGIKDVQIKTSTARSYNDEMTGVEFQFRAAQGKTGSTATRARTIHDVLMQLANE